MKFSEFSNLIYGISSKNDGKMNDNNENLKNIVLSNRKVYFDKLNINTENLVFAGLIHDKNIAIVTKNNKNTKIPSHDGLITKEKDLILAVTVSDCVPIYFYDHTNKVIGIAHSGWKGTVKNIANEVINKMKLNFNSDPKNILIYIGPHIQKCHFEIKDDIIEKFNDYKEFIFENDNKKFVNLSLIIKKQLIKAGIYENNIEISNECTFCNKEQYFSYRRDRTEDIDSMVAYLGLK